jgi:uncharacterized protein YhfF
MNLTPAVEQFCSAYVIAQGIEPPDITIVQFGDSAELADELVGLVLAGEKRATASLMSDYAKRHRTLPKPGDLGVVVDGKRAPRCLIRTVEVEIKPLRAVDERFARDEGGGDRSLAWWRSAHFRYFKRQAAIEGCSLEETAELVLERFEVVWPPEFADVHGRTKH